MSKELTEKWKNGELFGFHYVKVPKEEPKIHNVSEMDYLLDEYGVEVLSPVPSFQQFIGLMDDSKELDKAYDKINLLEKKLEIATKALKEYANKDKWSYCSEDIDYFYSTKPGYRDAEKALEEMEGVK